MRNNLFYSLFLEGFSQWDKQLAREWQINRRLWLRNLISDRDLVKDTHVIDKSTIKIDV